MGVDFTAIISHSLEADGLNVLVQRLRDVVPSEPSRWPKEFKEGYPGLFTGRQEWALALDPSYQDAAEELAANGTVSIEGPDGFLGVLNKRTVEIAHVTRWSRFLWDPVLGPLLDNLCQRIASALGDTTRIYLPDSCFAVSAASDLAYEGRSLDEVREHLASHYGPPLPVERWPLTDPEEDQEHLYMVVG